MPNDFEQCSAAVSRLHAALAALRPLADAVGVGSPVGSEWYELLEHKLRPQVEGTPYLVVAVVGGTNIGKSVVFNHLVGEEASAVSPLAAGTKHPVCLVPPSFDDERLLVRLFEGFELRPWHASTDPQIESDSDWLFWRVGRDVPERLLVLDTPDIDSDAQINWRRADGVRHVADVLVAVLTQQKYNDAAVKQFFRKAVQADKPVVVLFNQCDLGEDREYWPQWLATFADETGAAPELVYIVPYDRAGARERRLPFYEIGSDGSGAPDVAASLRNDLASLKFDRIKLRTLRGALARVTDTGSGAPAYLTAVRATSRQFNEAATALSATDMARVDWPSLPSELLVQEIREWWNLHRSPWSRNIHSVYRRVGRGVTWPVRTAWEAISGPAVDPLVAFRQRERAAILTAIERLLDELKRLASVGNDTLRPRLAALLQGDARAQLLRRIEASHATLDPVDDDYRTFLRAELDRWGRDNPRAITTLRSIDQVTAVARPAITVSLAVSGWVLAAGLVHGAAVHAATHSAMELATEAAVTGGVTTGGEALVDATTTGVRRAATRLFTRLQEHYARERAAWLAGWLERELLGPVLADLRRGAELSDSAAFGDFESALAELSQPVPALSAS
ncbi:MAG: GTPase domain-containing protein [Pirellulales bacterium]|nr:GTPase domain-containing protein [Pirellulales bacterium]